MLEKLIFAVHKLFRLLANYIRFDLNSTALVNIFSVVNRPTSPTS
jgi:hypothetical protein